MSSFVSPENQKLLWNTINKIDIFHTNISKNEQVVWFKNIIGMFYEKYKNTRPGVKELSLLNKETIRYMISNLKEMNKNIIPVFPNTYQSKPNPFTEQSTRDTFYSNNYSVSLQERELEYKDMVDKKLPFEPRLQETIEDKAIENIEELVQQQLKQRELDLSPVDSGTFHPSNNTPINIPINRDEPKKVSWRFSEEEHHEITELKKMILELSERLRILENKSEVKEVVENIVQQIN
jgi:hypothetical protein